MNFLEFEDFLRNVVGDTREKLRKAIDDDAKTNPHVDAPALMQSFAGCCGLAQCVAGYFLQDLGVAVKPIATQSLPGWRQGHALLCITAPDQAGGRSYLFDPTFIQFCHRTEESAHPTPPVDLLSGLGEKNATMLIQDGFVELTDEIAAAYLSFFCHGEMPFASPADCLAFCKDPYPHPYHFNAGDGTDRFSRAQLHRDGLSLQTREVVAMRGISGSVTTTRTATSPALRTPTF